MHACTQKYAAVLRRSFAKALVRHNGPKNASTVKVGFFLRRAARCVALIAKAPYVYDR